MVADRHRGIARTRRTHKPKSTTPLFQQRCRRAAGVLVHVFMKYHVSSRQAPHRPPTSVTPACMYKGRAHRVRQRTNNPAASTTLVPHRCRHHSLQHHQCHAPAAASRAAAFSGSPTTDRRNRNSNAKQVTGVLSTAGGRFSRLFGAADPSSEAEPAEEGDASAPEPPLSPAASAVSSDANRKSVSAGASDAATGRKGGAAGATAAAAVSVEGKGTGGGWGVGKEVAVTEGGRKQAAGPPAWAPRWAVNMHPAGQAALSIGLYFFHMVRRRCLWAARAYRLGGLGELSPIVHGIGSAKAFCTWASKSCRVGVTADVVRRGGGGSAGRLRIFRAWAMETHCKLVVTLSRESYVWNIAWAPK